MMAGTTYHSKAVGNVENIFFIAKDNLDDCQQKIALYELEDSGKIMNTLRYTEVHHVNVHQLELLIELLNELVQSGGMVSKSLADTKDIDECIMSLEPVNTTEEGNGDNSSIKCYRCPYCPNDFQNNMTLQVLRLHVKKIHRISCVEDFVCPKCTQSIFDPSSIDVKDDDNNAMNENVEDRNMLNQVFEPMNMEVAGEEIVEQPLVVMLRDESREVVQVVVDDDAKAIISYENVREYSCNLCNYQSSHKTHVKNHIRWVHQKIKDKFCPHCEFKCYQNGHLKGHIKRVHQKIKDFLCSHPDCKYKTGSKQDLKKHVRTVHEKFKNVQPKTFGCSQCAFRTANRNALELHVKTVHENIKDYSCPHCEQCFGQKGARDKHIKAVHEKIKDHVCNQCDYKTSYKNILDRHIKSVHERMKNFDCPECSSQFFDNHGLTKHIKAVHHKIKDIQCQMCNYQCSQTQHMKRHTKSIHGKS